MFNLIKSRSRVLLLIGIVIVLGFFTYIYFLQIYKPNNVSINKDSISVVIVPHFNLEKEKRQDLINSLSKRVDPSEIVLISVNHLSQGKQNIVTTDKSWEFSGQKPFNLNQSLFKELTSQGLISNEIGPFTDEHGVYNVLPEITNSWPNAKVLPIIIKNTTPKDEMDTLFNTLSQECAQCLLVASVDFSHYNPNSLAIIHDSYAISAISSLQDANAWNIESDSPQSLYLAMKWAAKRKTTNFSLSYNSNSGEKYGDNQTETTSYILGYFSDETLNKSNLKQSTSFLFGGDIMLDRNVYHKFKDAGSEHAFDKLGERVFWGVDLAIANLEGPISSAPINDDYLSGSMLFNFPPDSIKALEYLRVNAVSLANNHSENAGQKGLDYTRQLLTDNSITPIGNQTKYNSSSIKSFDTNIPLTVIAINMLESPNLDSIDNDIMANKDNYVIIFPHWGAEYQTTHGSSQETLAKRWIDAGADLIIGSHPHVVQDCQIYKNKFIAYSMGNFVFDQYFSKETERGMLIGGIITDNSTTISLFPITIDKSQPQFSVDNNRQIYIDRCLANLDNSLFNKVRDDTILINN